jgi:anti-sigma factor RsiW
MECRKWEETGLLYSAGELDMQEAGEYETHLRECEECRTELSSYRSERERFYTEAVLGVAPSAEIDAEMLRVCSDPRPRIRIAAPALFTAFFRRRVVVPIMLFAAGFISVGYIMMNMENARQMAARAQPPAPQVQVAEVKEADSLKDSLDRDSGVNFARTRGNLNDKGVVTVDLKK